MFIIILIFSVKTLASNGPVATVNGKSITSEIFEQTYKQNQMIVTHEGQSKEKVLTDLINRELGIERAYATKLQDNPDVKRKMEDVLFHAQISKDLAPLYETIVVTDDNVEKYYKEYPEYRTAHILLRMTTNPTKDELASADKKSVEIYKILQKNPEKFPELANKYSQSMAAPNGGDVGFRPAIKLAREYFMAIKNKPINYISPPVKTQFGIHIIKILGVKPYKDIDKLFYKNVIYGSKRDKITDDYYAKLRKNAQIKIFKSNM